jgi:hypothetical protein
MDELKFFLCWFDGRDLCSPPLLTEQIWVVFAHQLFEFSAWNEYTVEFMRS